MPVERDDRDGRIIDELTRRVTEKEQTEGTGGRGRAVNITGLSDFRSTRPTAPIGGSAPAGGRFDDPTTPVGAPEAGGDPERTRLVGRGSRAEGEEAEAVGPMDDPPVGWLVVVEGPGKGSVATLGSGVNSIGRDRSERVTLDYGDTMISRSNHGSITYDPRGRKFYVQHGGGKNLTYVDDEPVLAPRELPALTQVQLGETVLRFVPLCGPEFSWEDDSNGD